MDGFDWRSREKCDVHEKGFFVIATLILMTWLLGVALFWYTDIERSTSRLSMEILAIRFESHLIVAKAACHEEAVVLKRSTGTIGCRPLESNMVEVEIQLNTGEKHKEVIYFDD